MQPQKLLSFKLVNLPKEGYEKMIQEEREKYSESEQHFAARCERFFNKYGDYARCYT